MGKQRNKQKHTHKKLNIFGQPKQNLTQQTPTPNQKETTTHRCNNTTCKCNNTPNNNFLHPNKNKEFDNATWQTYHKKIQWIGLSSKIGRPIQRKHWGRLGTQWPRVLVEHVINMIWYTLIAWQTCTELSRTHASDNLNHWHGPNVIALPNAQQNKKKPKPLNVTMSHWLNLHRKITRLWQEWHHPNNVPQLCVGRDRTRFLNVCRDERSTGMTLNNLRTTLSLHLRDFHCSCVTEPKPLLHFALLTQHSALNELRRPTSWFSSTWRWITRNMERHKLHGITPLINSSNLCITAMCKPLCRKTLPCP